MEFFQANVFGTSVIGIFARANDKFCLIPNNIGKFLEAEIKRTLGVPLLQVRVMDSNLVGLFTAANNKCVVSFEKLDVAKPVGVLESKYSCLGNLILANDNGALVSPLLKKEVEKIAGFLKVKAEVGTVAGLSIVGSAAVATNQGVLAHPGIKKEEVEQIESLLKVPVGVGTLNRGSPYVGACCIANSRGAILGYITTPVEATYAEEALGG